MRIRCVVLLLTTAAAVCSPIAASAQWPSSGQAQIQWPDPPQSQAQPRAQEPRPQAAPKSKQAPRPQAQQQDIEELTPSQIQRAQEPEPKPGAASKAPPAAKPKPKSNSVVRVVACSGAFARNSSHIRLAQVFGSQNVAFTEVEGPDNSKLMASVLYPRDPRQRLEILWENEASRSETQVIVINGSSTWNGPRGLKIGLDLAAIQRANGKPFKLSAFDGDGATILDWGGGAFASLPGGCKINIRVVMDSRAPEAVRAPLANGKEHVSSDATLRAARPALAEILVGY